MIEQLSINIANYLLKKNSGYYKSIAKGVDGVAVDIVGQKVANVVKKHANTVTLSGLADGIPLGAAVSSTMLVASVWKMYYDINNILGISFSENFLKSVASGVASNLVGTGVSVAGHTVANAISAVPVAGTVIAATAGAATNRMACYSQATTYLKLLNKIVETGGDFSEESLQTVLDSCPDSSYTDYYDDDNVEEEAFYDDDDDSEWEAFNRRWLNYSDMLTSSSIGNIESFVESCAERAEECNNDAIGSCYYFMASWACYGYMEGKDDSTKDYQLAHQMGLETINNAIDLLEDDEYLILKSLYELAAIDVEDSFLSDIMYIKECLPQISELENNLISEKYWNQEFNSQYIRKLSSLTVVNKNRLEEDEYEDVEQEYEDTLLEYISAGERGIHSLIGICDLIELYRKRGDEANVFKYSKIGHDKAVLFGWDALDIDSPVYLFACPVVRNYGECLLKGIGTEVDENRAFEIFEMLYQAKYPEGTSKLAEMYEMGKGVHQDVSKAIKLYEEAVEQAKRDKGEYGGTISIVQTKLNKLQKDASTTSTSCTNNSSEEQEYVEMLQDCMADGGISERDRKALDRLRRALGISEKRAAEIEESLKQPQLTDDEAEYWEAYKDAKADGDISERDRRSLDRLRRALGISEQRAAEIERM